jgi:hypothetical protein
VVFVFKEERLFNRHWGKDRRRFQRFLLNLTIWYKVRSPEYLRTRFGDADIEATTLNLNQAGVAFLSKQQIPPWSSLIFKFIFFGADEANVHIKKPVEILGEVRSCTPYDNEFRLGVFFKDVDESIKEELNCFIQSMARPYK